MERNYFFLQLRFPTVKISLFLFFTTALLKLKRNIEVEHWKMSKCFAILASWFTIFWVNSPREYAKAFYITAVDDGEECCKIFRSHLSKKFHDCCRKLWKSHEGFYCIVKKLKCEKFSLFFLQASLKRHFMHTKWAGVQCSIVIIILFHPPLESWRSKNYF